MLKNYFINEIRTCQKNQKVDLEERKYKKIKSKIEMIKIQKNLKNIFDQNLKKKILDDEIPTFGASTDLKT